MPPSNVPTGPTSGSALVSAGLRPPTRVYDEVESGIAKLREMLEKLSIQIPDPTRAPSTLHFGRARELRIDWPQLLKKFAGKSPALVLLKRYIERSWGIEDGMSDARRWELIQPNLREYDNGTLIRPSSPPKSVGAWTTDNVEVIAAASQAALFGAATVGGTKRRIYRFIPASNYVLKKADFADLASYDATWNDKDKLAGVELVAEKSTLGTPKILPFMESEVLDLAAAVIMREFRHLDARRVALKALSTAADHLITKITAATTADEDLDRLAERYVDLKTRRIAIDDAIEQLSDRASNLNLVLYAGEEETKVVNSPDGSQFTMHSGHLYRCYKTTYYWTTTHHRPYWTWIGGVLVYVWWHQERILHAQVGDKYEEVKVDLDPWVEKEHELHAAGFTVHRFDFVSSTYQTPDGVSLEQIMRRCDVDETYRQQCAVMLPVYEQSLRFGTTLVRYLVVRKPLPGVVPVGFPRAVAEERLSYKIAWEGSEMGELAHTINMGPGEQRKITVARSMTRERDDRRATTSLLDLQESESTDLATQIEHETRQDRSEESSSNWNVQASFSVPFFSAGGGGGGSSSKSLKDMARNLESVSRKAAASVKRQTRTEVSTSSTSKTTSTHSETTEISIRNINEGATLNLLFYRINNIFSATLYLDDVGLVVQSPIELVQGTGIRGFRYFTRSEESAQAAFVEVSQMGVPLDLTTADQSVLETEILSAFLDAWVTLLKSYDQPDGRFLKLAAAVPEKEMAHKNAYLAWKSTLGGDKDGDATTALAKLKKTRRELLVSLEGVKFVDVLPKVWAPEDGSAKPDSTPGATETPLPTDPNAPKPVSRTFMSIPSGAMFLDSIMGIRPATEPYADAMRLQEIRFKEAEVEKEYAAARKTQAEGWRHVACPCGHDPVRITAVAVPSKRNLILDLSAPLPYGEWRLVYDGTFRELVPGEWVGLRRLDFRFTADMPWLATGKPGLAILREQGGVGAIGP